MANKDKNTKKTQTAQKPEKESKELKKQRKDIKKRGGGLNTSYLTKMGAHNLVANRSMSFSSITVLSACLLLIGISMIIIMNVQNLVKDVVKQNIVVAFVADGADEATVNAVEQNLKAIPDVIKVEFVSKEAAYQEQLNEFGVEEGLFDDVIENPLPDSFRVSVGNLEQFQQTLVKIKSVPNVIHVRESMEIVNDITTMQKSITAICVMLVIVLSIVSMFIVSNTIKITMVSRKNEIQVMKSVGATSLFICWPFMIEGAIIGVISGLIALGITFLVENFEGADMSKLFELFGSETIEIKQYLPMLAAAYIISGIIISSFGSLVSIRKYLKKEGSEANEIA
ncbi:MAG: cell division protein FtsX [Acutalibacteraceae bacterium]